MISSLIYDRTQQDLLNETDKAFISYLDLNRIENAVKYLSDLLNTYGYTNTTINKTDWSIDELRKQEDCDRIKTNYEALKNAYAYKFEVPAFNWATIQEANNIEKILADIENMIDNMKTAFRYSNTFYAGEMEGLI